MFGGKQNNFECEEPNLLSLAFNVEQSITKKSLGGFFLLKKVQKADRKMAEKIALDPFICRRDDRSGIMPKTLNFYSTFYCPATSPFKTEKSPLAHESWPRHAAAHKTKL